MSLLSHIKRLYDYTYWAHHRVWQHAILPLSDEQYHRPLAYSIGSIHQQVVHTMSAEWMWFSRMRGETPRAMLDPADFPDRPAVRARWDEVEAMVRAYLEALSEADLDRRFEYRTTGGTPDSQPLGEVLLHVVNHGTDHRAQMLAQIHAMGGPTIEQDLIFYLRGR
jgi:uncharacterized damage-inducible protein DinB